MSDAGDHKGRPYEIATQFNGLGIFVGATDGTTDLAGTTPVQSQTFSQVPLSTERYMASAVRNSPSE